MKDQIPKTIEHRLGYIDVTNLLLNQQTGIFKWFNPLWIENRDHGVKRILCASEMFDELKQKEKIPDYEITVRSVKLNTGDYEIEIEKVERK